MERGAPWFEFRCDCYIIIIGPREGVGHGAAQPHERPERKQRIGQNIELLIVSYYGELEK